MQIHNKPDGVVLEFFPAEAHFLAGILDRIARTYEEDASGGARAPELGNSGYAGEDIEAWNAECHEWGSENAALARKWSAHLREDTGEWIRWGLSPEEVEKFLLLSNDHRMYLARRFKVTEADMELMPDEMEGDERRMVLLEIHLLAQLMELLLPHAPL